MHNTDPDRSFVALESHLCKVCGTKFETGNLLFDKHLRPKLAKHTVTGWGMCPEHQRLADEGYVALIEIKNAPDHSIELHEANRTGRIMHMRKAKAEEMFSAPILRDIAFIDRELFDQLASLIPGEPA